MNNRLASKLSPGHSTCAGCSAPIVARMVLDATDSPVVVSGATGCLEVTTTVYPNTSWKVPYIHSAFENAAATISGVEAAYNALEKRGKIKLKQKPKFVVFAGDGGTYDIGLQALSGALERQQDFLYVCYDNGAYMNTGNQRSGATPLGADTETTPFGKESFGKQVRRKDIMGIVAAHHIAYAATANIAFLADFKKKLKKAMTAQGPRFLLVLAPCTNQWKYDPAQTVDISRLASETNFWPLYEIENGKYRITYTPSQRKPIEDFYGVQGRFKHLFRRPDKELVLNKIQAQLDDEWQRLNNLVVKN